MPATSQALRILLVTARYFPCIGGTETHVYEVGRRLADMGMNVTVLTTDPSGRLPTVEESDGMHIRRVRAWLMRGGYYFAPDIYSVITNGGWDVVHCQGVHTLVAPLAMLAAYRARIPYVVTFHTGPHSSYLRNAVRGLQWTLLHPLLSQAERLIGVSQFEVDKFRKQLGLAEGHFAIIPNGGSLPEVTTPLSWGANGTLIASVGRLERCKGHHRIIAALPTISQHYPDVCLRIVGVGPYEAALRRLSQALGVADRVQIEAIPAKDRLEMAQVLSSASLVTQLSTYESQGITVLEALTLRRPVLVTDTAALHEFAEQGLVRAIPLESTVEEVAEAALHQLYEPLVPSQVKIPTWDECANDLLVLYYSLNRQVVCRQ